MAPFKLALTVAKRCIRLTVRVLGWSVDLVVGRAPKELDDGTN